MSKGGGGAYNGRDGGHLWGLAGAGGANMTGEIELLEFRLPIHVIRHEFLTDPGVPRTLARRLRRRSRSKFNVRNASSPTPAAGSSSAEQPARRRVSADSDIRVHKVWVRDGNGKTDELYLHSLRHLRAGDRVLRKVAGGGAVGPAWMGHWMRSPQTGALD